VGFKIEVGSPIPQILRYAQDDISILSSQPRTEFSKTKIPFPLTRGKGIHPEGSPEGIIGNVQPLDIQVFNALGVGLDESLAGRDFVTHQHAEDVIGLGGIGDIDGQQGTGSGVHGGLPELLGAHFT
jgi:hypothetical protein